MSAAELEGMTEGESSERRAERTEEAREVGDRPQRLRWKGTVCAVERGGESST